MYLQHFGLIDKPFRVVPSPRFLYASDTHDEGRARILYGVRESRGFVVVTGAVGLGKTTVLLSVLDQLEADVRVALVFNPVEDFAQLLRAIAYEFGIEAQGKDEVTLLRELNLFLVARLAEGETSVLLIDEAQNLPIPVLERLRTLSNLQTEESSLLQIVLVGQPELMEKLDDSSLLQLRQRVGVWFEVRPLDTDETAEYIAHRLRLSGAAVPERLIDRGTSAAVHRVARGVPRVINQVCDTALVIAFGEGCERVRREHIDEAASELRLDIPRAASSASSPAEATSSAEPDASTPRRWGYLVAASIVALLLFGAWKLGALESVSRWGPGAGDSTAAVVQEPVRRVEAPVTDAEFVVEPAGSESAASFEDHSAERRAEVAGWQSQGQTVFAAHLASFREESHAQDFADMWVASDPLWSEPFFVEQTDGPEPWFRVLGGGFRSRGEARSWIDALKSQRQLDYAQLSRLDPSARALVAVPVDHQRDRGESR